MAVVQEMGKPNWVRTCDDLAQHVCTQIKQRSSGYDEIHVVFDRYDLDVSLKASTRARRLGGSTPICYSMTDNTPLSKVPLKKLLSHTNTKDQLTSYFSEKILDTYKESHQTVIVAYKQIAISNKVNIDTLHLHSSHEEADTKLMLHAKHAAETGATSLDIQSPDTDVLVLAIRRYPELHTSTNFITGSSGARRTISLQRLYTKLGARNAASLPGFHAFTGTDQTGRFSGKSKTTCFKTFISSSDDIKDAFCTIGKTILPTEDTHAKLEEFVCQLYASGTLLRDVASLRWRLFCKNQAEGEKLPPTKGALHQATLRAHYQAMIWEADTVPMPNLPDPTDYGWTVNEDVYCAVPTLNPPAPKAVVELIRCQCLRSKCETRCSCKQHNMYCSEMCVCASNIDNCQNKIENASLFGLAK